jgi:hypothetical protein
VTLPCAHKKSVQGGSPELCLQQATDVTRPIAHGAGVGHSRSFFLMFSRMREAPEGATPMSVRFWLITERTVSLFLKTHVTHSFNILFQFVLAFFSLHSFLSLFPHSHFFLFDFGSLQYKIFKSILKIFCNIISKINTVIAR